MYVAPFAEEMNKARRMAALQAQQLAGAGYAVLGMDLLGCGDSSGDFGDASWEAWLDDLQAAHAWLAAQLDAPDWLWGLRAGCLLAAALGARLAQPCAYLFWQPPASGKLLLQQFLRLKTVGEALEGAGGATADTLKRQLLGGETVEVAGYRLSPALAQGLEVSLLSMPAQARRLVVLELSTREVATLSPVVNKLVTAWQQAGCGASAVQVPGPAFWQTSEIEDAPALLKATLEALYG
jgi:uncharacterized protein